MYMLMIQRFVMPEKQTTQSKSGRKPETDISQKKKKKKKHKTQYRWPANTQKDAQHPLLLKKCKSKLL